MLLALEHPDRVERVLALDVAPPWLQIGLPTPRHLALPLLASYQAILATPLLGKRLLTSGPELVRTVIRAGSGSTARWTNDELDVYAKVLRELTRELPHPGHPKLEVPTLLAMGAESSIFRILRPRSERNLHVTTVAAAGHFIPEEAPAAVLCLADAWLNA
jgi:pimeloyl-ACP methyl ester carboxylesterase